MATIAVVLVAAFATVATSPAEDSREDRVDGTPFVLSPEHPEVTVRFTFDANEAALTDYEHLQTWLGYQGFWSDTPHDAVPEIDATMTKVAGPSVEEARLRRSSCTRLPECVGTYDVTLRWPEELDSGSVRIEWFAHATITWWERMAPEGAEVTVSVEDPADLGDAPRRFFEHTTELRRSEPLSSEAVSISLLAPLPRDVDLAFELSPETGGSVSVPLVQEDRATSERVHPGTVFPLHVPERCRESVCSFRFSIAPRIDAPSDRGSPRSMPLHWALTSTRPLDDIDVVVSTPAVPELQARADLGSFSLGHFQTSRPVTVTARIPAGALPAEELGTEPALALLFRTDIRLDISDLSGPADLVARLVFPDDLEHRPVNPTWFFRDARPDPAAVDADPMRVFVPNDCRPQQDCEVTFTLTFDTHERSGETDPSIDFDAAVELAIPYPLSRRVPEGAAIDVTVENGQ